MISAHTNYSARQLTLINASPACPEADIKFFSQAGHCDACQATLILQGNINCRPLQSTPACPKQALINSPACPEADIKFFSQEGHCDACQATLIIQRNINCRPLQSIPACPKAGIN